MKAEITYKVSEIYHPWDTQRSGQLVWCLIKVTKPEYGRIISEPVALFNLDSEAVTFQGHLVAVEGTNVVGIDPMVLQIFGKKNVT